MRPEHIPVDAYYLLRQIANGVRKRGPFETANDHAAIGFLKSRKLVSEADDGEITLTEEGKNVGRILKSGKGLG
tara:strand:+ start:283 stop:504 length:222 start_codon:yes stop_codon:yes gene_type:complete